MQDKSLVAYKSQAKRAAIELYYQYKDKDILKKISNAKTEHEVDTILASARSKM